MTEPLRIADSSMMTGLFSNASLLAEALNISSRRVYQLVDEGVLEKEGAKFDFVKCLQKYIAYIQSLTPVFADAEEELQQQQIRLTKARADKTEVGA